MSVVNSFEHKDLYSYVLTSFLVKTSFNLNKQCVHKRC